MVPVERERSLDLRPSRRHPLKKETHWIQEADFTSLVLSDISSKALVPLSRLAHNLQPTKILLGLNCFQWQGGWDLQDVSHWAPRSIRHDIQSYYLPNVLVKQHWSHFIFFSPLKYSICCGPLWLLRKRVESSRGSNQLLERRSGLGHLETAFSYLRNTTSDMYPNIKTLVLCLKQQRQKLLLKF